MQMLTLPPLLYLITGGIILITNQTTNHNSVMDILMALTFIYLYTESVPYYGVLILFTISFIIPPLAVTLPSIYQKTSLTPRFLGLYSILTILTAGLISFIHFDIPIPLVS